MNTKIAHLTSLKNFYCKEFCISLKFEKAGGISGVLYLSPNILNHGNALNGLYYIDEHKIKFTYTIEREDRNLSFNTLTCSSGEIFQYNDNNECLILRSVVISKSKYGKMEAVMESDTVLLFDREVENIEDETKKVIPQIPADIFETRFLY